MAVLTHEGIDVHVHWRTFIILPSSHARSTISSRKFDHGKNVAVCSVKYHDSPFLPSILAYVLVTYDELYVVPFHHTKAESDVNI